MVTGMLRRLSLPLALMQVLPRCERLVNFYGPTECTVGVSLRRGMMDERG